MKKSIITLGVLIVIFAHISCGNENKPKKISLETNLKEDTILSFEKYNNPLFNEIDGFIKMIDSIPKSKYFRNVVIVRFYENNGGLFVELRTCYYYPVTLEGYAFLDGYMIAFYNTKIWPSNEILERFPKVEIPDNFKSEAEIHYRHYEALVKKYQIISSDSIKLVGFSYE